MVEAVMPMVKKTIRTGLDHMAKGLQVLISDVLYANQVQIMIGLALVREGYEIPNREGSVEAIQQEQAPEYRLTYKLFVNYAPVYDDVLVHTQLFVPAQEFLKKVARQDGEVSFKQIINAPFDLLQKEALMKPYLMEAMLKHAQRLNISPLNMGAMALLDEQSNIFAALYDQAAEAPNDLRETLSLDQFLT